MVLELQREVVVRSSLEDIGLLELGWGALVRLEGVLALALVERCLLEAFSVHGRGH